ncbi:MAG TPA: ACP S-malonyltransferase [Allocoleopsis sp.]
MKKTAFIFPGQGSQSLGMGIDLLEIPTAKEKFDQAAEILGWSVIEICQNQEEKLSQTLYTQPCLYVVETILTDLLKEHQQKADLVAGHSLGEYVALYAAGVFNFTDGLKLVKKRAELMDQASGGMMAALIGFDREQLDTEISKIPDVILANDNSPAQVVISGTPAGVETLLKNIKVKKAVPLKVSGAFHSPLMQDAATKFTEILTEVEFKNAEIPVLSNVDPTPTQDGVILKERLTKQMTGSVRWREISLKISELGMNQVIEIGPGKVLTGLIKRMCPELELVNISTLAELSNI